MLNRVLKLVKETKSIIFDAQKQSDVTIKGYGNYVTQVDCCVQSFLKTSLQTFYPNIQFMGEEGEHAELDFSKFVWILDPIDGTANLVRNLNQSAVSLALVENRTPILGVVYNPFADEIFYAEKDKGAFLNGERIAVSKASSLKNSLISIGTAPYNKELADDIFQSVCEIYKHCEDVRRFGAAAIELCNLAAGRIDGFFEKRLKPWDYAAGAVILKEAGGKITNYERGTISFERPDDIIASNGLFHDEFTNILNNCL